MQGIVGVTPVVHVHNDPLILGNNVLFDLFFVDVRQDAESGQPEERAIDLRDFATRRLRIWFPDADGQYADTPDVDGDMTLLDQVAEPGRATYRLTDGDYTGMPSGAWDADTPPHVKVRGYLVDSVGNDFYTDPPEMIPVKKP